MLELGTETFICKNKNPRLKSRRFLETYFKNKTTGLVFLLLEANSKVRLWDSFLQINLYG
jgi:hypothetical protein